MAHKGKFYELWFRRDFAVNQLNSSGYPRFFTWVQPDLKSTSGAGHLILPFNFSNDQKGPGDTRTWTSNILAVNGLHWVAEFTVINDPNLGWTDVQIDIHTDFVLNAFTARYKLAESPSFHYQSFAASFPDSFQATPLCEYAGGFFGVELLGGGPY